MPEIRIIKDLSTETNPFMYVETDCHICGEAYNTMYNYLTGMPEETECWPCRAKAQGIDPYEAIDF